jgi:hypothetical protein
MLLLALSPRLRRVNSMNGVAEQDNAITRKPRLAQRSRPPLAIFDALLGKKRVVVAGACSKNGQFVARFLAKKYGVTALCRQEIGQQIADDDGAMLNTGVGCIGFGASVAADAIVVATDEAPSAAAVSALLKPCREQGVPHAVFLSRLGASKNKIGLGAWKKAEDAAVEAFGEDGLTIVRVGSPVIGGPYYKLDPDLTRWSSAQAVDGQKILEIQAGDEVSQGGLGTPPYAAAAAIESVLRRGPETQPSGYSVVSKSGKATPGSELDAMLTQAGGVVESSNPKAASVKWDLEDSLLTELSVPQAPKPPSPIDILFGPPAVSGQYWGVILSFVWGTWYTTQPAYIEATGINYWENFR